MSLRAMSWVMNEAPIDDARQLLVLYALADRAHDDGTCSWPSQEWIAERARCSSRTVRRHLQKLEQSGLIKRGDQKHVAHISVDRRPIVWDLNIGLVRPDILTGRTSGAKRPDTLDQPAGHLGPNGRTQLCPTNRPKPSMNPTEPLSAPGGAHGHPEGFEAFFLEYPRKSDKRGALKRYREQLEVTDHDTLMRSVKNFRAEMERLQTEQRYIPMCKTWLNQGRWRDFVDYAPKRSGKEKLDQALAWLEEI